MVLGLAVIAVAAGVIWWFIPAEPKPAGTVGAHTTDRTITSVEIDPDDPLQLLVRRGYGDKELLHEFPARAGSIKGAVMVDLGARGRTCVVAGTDRALDGACVFMFDEDGKEIWRKNLSDGRHWPDCVGPRNWGCREIKVADLDRRRPGPELAVAAGDNGEYPCGVFVLDPDSGDVRHAFWHAGGIPGIEILDGFFDDGRPAILAWGQANKLDGPGDPASPDYEGPKYTDYAIVSVVMILDPMRMDGLGPPHADYMFDHLPHMQKAYLYAYAFLDAPTNDKPYCEPGTGKLTRAELSEWFFLGGCYDSGECEPADESRPCIAAPLTQNPQLSPKGGGTLIVDRNLNVREFRASSGAVVARDTEYWRHRWHPIIQNYEYVDD